MNVGAIDFLLRVVGHANLMQLLHGAHASPWKKRRGVFFVSRD